MDRTLASIDLNLLVVLDALLAERSVTGAARRLGLSQSATSHALGRLRDALDDPLFVRTAHGMVPTARADRLSGPLRAALSGLREALAASAPFDPSAATGTVQICAADIGHTLIVPGLCARVAALAPGVVLVTTGMPDDVDRLLADGRTDVAIGLAGRGPDLQQVQLMVQPFRCVVREGHPCLRDGPQPLSLDDYASLGHVLVSPRGVARGFVDRALAELGRSRRIALVAPHLLPAARAVADSDLVLTAPERMAEVAASLLPLRVLEPPLPVEPFVLTMSWHERRSADPLHAWIREQIVAITEAADPS